MFVQPPLKSRQEAELRIFELREGGVGMEVTLWLFKII